MREHEAGLRRYLRRLAPDDADDLAQEAMLVAWRSCSQWRGEARFATWLRGIATRRFLDQRRKAQRRSDAQPPAEFTAAPPLETQIQIDHALAALPPRERAAALLVFAEGQSHQEAASTLGVPLGSLKSIVARARDRLMTSLEGVSP